MRRPPDDGRDGYVLLADDRLLFAFLLPLIWDVATDFDLPLEDVIPDPMPSLVWLDGCSLPSEHMVFVTLRLMTPMKTWEPNRLPDLDILKRVAHGLTHLRVTSCQHPDFAVLELVVLDALRAQYAAHTGGGR